LASEKRGAQHNRRTSDILANATASATMRTIPLTFQTEVVDGCPADCGLCPEHKQHACLGTIEVNTGCNLDCPICLADSGHHPDGHAITVEQRAATLDARLSSPKAL
jgi:uncharacterized radical SAM superfamily Fe-S cluster-containing enzyme